MLASGDHCHCGWQARRCRTDVTRAQTPAKRFHQRLHFADIQKLLEVLLKLRDQGNTLIVIEHNLEVIKCADWVIDLGPEGGRGGGQVIAQGTPEQVVLVKGSHTGRYLQRALAPE